jgi:hypothetical protein
MTYEVASTHESLGDNAFGNAKATPSALRNPVFLSLFHRHSSAERAL